MCAAALTQSPHAPVLIHVYGIVIARTVTRQLAATHFSWCSPDPDTSPLAIQKDA